MVSQADLGRRENGATHPSPARMRKELGDVASDVFRLMELQFQLLRADASESLGRVRGPLIGMAAAAVVAAACVTVALVGLGCVLAWAVEMPVGFALLLVAMVVLGICLALAAGAWTRITGAMDPLGRSGAEFRENVQWIKGALGYGQKPESRGREPRKN